MIRTILSTAMLLTASCAHAAMAPDAVGCAFGTPTENEKAGAAANWEVPDRFRPIAAATPPTLAIATLDGRTICADLSWADSIAGMETLQGGRFLAWEWSGDEAFGYRIADRVGAGAIIETGSRPVFSPGGSRFVALQVSDSGFGALEGFGVWEIAADGIRPVARQAAKADGIAPAPFTRSGDWSVVGWAGEDCVELAFRPAADSTIGEAQSYLAARSRGWAVESGQCP